MLTAAVLMWSWRSEKPVQRLGASRIAHRPPLNACRTRHPPRYAHLRRAGCPVSLRGGLIALGGLQPQDLLEASPAHQFSGQVARAEVSR
jgi:hypothetical protein